MSEHAFPLIVDHEREYLAGDVIRKAVEHDAATMRFYLTCSVGELAQRVVLALPVPPASAPAATPEPEKFAATNESLAAHDWRYDQKLTPEMRAKVSRPAAPTGEAAETLHAAASDLRHVANGGSCAPETLLAHADALLTTQATALAALRARVSLLPYERERIAEIRDHYPEPPEWGDLTANAPAVAIRYLLEVIGRLTGATDVAALAPRQTTEDEHD